MSSGLGMDRASFEKRQPLSEASNSWVVGAQRSTSGKPLIANDPHLGLVMPSTWYLARVETPDYTWTGATAPGVTRTVAVVAYSNTDGTTAVNASTSSPTPDPVPANNLGSVSVQVGFLVEEIPALNGYALILLGLLLFVLVGAIVLLAVMWITKDVIAHHTGIHVFAPLGLK